MGKSRNLKVKIDKKHRNILVAIVMKKGVKKHKNRKKIDKQTHKE